MADMNKQITVNKVKSIVENAIENNLNSGMPKILLNNNEYEFDNYINIPYLETHFYPNTLLFILSRRVDEKGNFETVKIRVKDTELLDKLYKAVEV